MWIVKIGIDYYSNIPYYFIYGRSSGKVSPCEKSIFVYNKVNICIIILYIIHGYSHPCSASVPDFPGLYAGLKTTRRLNASF